MRSVPLALVLPFVLAVGPSDSDRLTGRMRAHWRAASALHTEVIHGRLDVVREIARSLSGWPDDEVPPELRPGLARLRTAATRVANANDVEQAVAAVAELGGVCADCHRASGGGPADVLTSAPPSGRTRRMTEHQLAADRMWLGLVRPSQASWDRGARDLARELPDTDPGPSFADAALESDLRAVAARAIGEADPAQRVARIREVLLTCAACHRLVEEDPHHQ